MRIRTIKPEFWTNEELSEISTEATLLAIGLLNYVDDEGYFNANNLLIKSAIFPIRKLSKSIDVLLKELQSINYIVCQNGTDGKTYGFVNNFTKHQVIQRPKVSKIKDLIAINDSSMINHIQVNDASMQEGKGKERKGTGKGREQLGEISLDVWQEKKGELTVDDFEKFITENNLDKKLVEKELLIFKDKAQAKGYKYQNWLAAFNSWIRNENYGNGIAKFKKASDKYQTDYDPENGKLGRAYY